MNEPDVEAPLVEKERLILEQKERHEHLGQRKLELADNVVNLLRHSLRRGSQIVFQGL